MKREAFLNPKEPIKIYDGDFSWPNGNNDLISTCNLKVYRFGIKQIAVALEIGDNRGPSITNASECLWFNVLNKFGDCLFFESYDEEVFDAVDISHVSIIQSSGYKIWFKGNSTWHRVGSWDDVLMSVK